MSLPARTDLGILLRKMSPVLAGGEYVFCTFPAGTIPAALSPVGTFHEKEGASAICLRRNARRLGLPFTGRYRLITLTVHSSLAAVGFLAAVTAALAAAGVPCNAVSAYHHDHLFVPSVHARRALGLLRRLARPGPRRARGAARRRPRAR